MRLKSVLIALAVSMAWMAQLRCAIADTTPRSSDKPTLLVLLLDGARWDLLNAGLTPNLNRLAQAGAPGEMIPVWPSVSFPNHWALATGLYPIHGGIYHNGGHQETHLHGEPIWTTVSSQGGVSGVIGDWGGGTRASMLPPGPTFSLPYRPKNDDYSQAAELIVPLLDQDEAKRPQLVAMHFMEPDVSQHLHGVGSPETNTIVQQIDQMIGDLVSRLRARGLSGEVNILVVADHGQTNRRNTDTIYFLEDFVDRDDLATPLAAGGPDPVAFLLPRKDREDAVYTQLSHAGLHLHVFRSSDIPARWHCCDFGLESPLIVTTDPGSWVSERAFQGTGVIGSHGFDNAFRDMHALFIAAGPAIKAGVHVKPFENVDLYSLMAAILRVSPAKTDGSIQPLCSILVDAPPSCVSHFLKP